MGIQFTPPGGSLNNIVEDVTPQLGGSLDVNGQSIVTTSDGNIVLAPDGTGVVALIPGIKLVMGTSFTPVGVLEANFLLSQDIDAKAGIEFRNLNTGLSAESRLVISDTSGHYMAFDVPSINNTQTNLFGLSRKTTDFIFNTSGTARDIAIGSLNDKAIVLGTFNAERIRIDSSGLKLSNDNYPLQFGDDQDATIEFNSTSLNIVANAVTASDTITITADNFNLDTTGVFFFKETTTPTPQAGYGAIYTTTINELFFQDGAGNVHLLQGNAFSNIWFHGIVTAVTIGAQDAFILIDTFENVGREDDLGNVIGNATTNTLTIGANGGGIYALGWHASFSANGASREMLICPGVTFASAEVITLVTDSAVSPIVVTSAGHGLLNGEMVEISGVGGNTNANGSFMIASKTDDTFELVALDGAATTGNANYTSGGTIDIHYPGNLMMHREVSQTDIGHGGHEANFRLDAGDVVSMYVANLDAASDLNIYGISCIIKRIGD